MEAIRIFSRASETNEKLVIFFIPEGYQREHARAFANHCFEFIRFFLHTTPFNLLKTLDFGGIDIYHCFLPGDHDGLFLTNQPNSTRNRFEGVVDPATKLIDFNRDKIEAAVLDIKSKVHSLDNNISANHLVVILAPHHPAMQDGAENEFYLGDNNTLCVATTVTGLWQQLIIRGIGKQMGLAEEYLNLNRSSDEDSPYIHIGELINFMNPNLFFSQKDPEELKFEDSFWKYLIPKALQTRNFGEFVAPDKTALPYSNEIVFPYDIGEGQKINVFRSGADCLLYRRIGDINFPIRKERVPFCLVCETYLRSKILKGAAFKQGILPVPESE